MTKSEHVIFATETWKHTDGWFLEAYALTFNQSLETVK
jgi:hypothetical protein